MSLSTKALWGACGAAVLLTGCANYQAPAPPAPAAQAGAAEPPVTTQEIVAVTDRMARGIIALHAIATADTPPHILLEPVVNDTAYPIDERMFLVRVRTELNSKSEGKARFIDADMRRKLEEERALQQGGEASSREPDYILTSRIEGGAADKATGVSDSVRYSFRLINAQTNELVWSDSAVIKRQGLQDTAPVQP